MFFIICLPPGPKTTQSKPENTDNRPKDDGGYKVFNKDHIPAGSEIQTIKFIKKSFKFRLGPMKHQK